MDKIEMLKDIIMRNIVIFLKEKKEEYEKQGLIPTLELLINDLEEND